MADILIKDMEMPTSCLKCPFLDYEEGFCSASGVKGKNGGYSLFTLWPGGIKDARADNCPLVPVQTPHGRLIDADAALRDGWTISRTYSASPTEMVYEAKAIDCLPTIIPAEE